MDKPKVSIKINGREKSFLTETKDDRKEQKLDKQENPSSHKDDRSNNIESTFSYFQAPYLAKEEMAASKEEREFDWILPETDRTQNENKLSKFNPIVPIDTLRKKKKPMIQSIPLTSKISNRNKHAFPIKTLLLAIISALVIGTSFGMIVLHIFTNNIDQPAISEPVVAPVEQPAENNEVDGQAGSVGDSGPITLPELNVFVVQGGVFSSEESAKPILEELSTNGFAGTIVKQDEKYYLFMGLGATDQAGKSIREPYETQGTETYVKALVTPEVSRNGDPEIIEARVLFDRLVLYTSNLYLSLPESVKWEDVQKANNELSGTGESDLASSFIHSVKQAYTSVETYKSSLSNQDFWSSQQALLESYKLYQNWILE